MRNPNDYLFPAASSEYVKFVKTLIEAAEGVTFTEEDFWTFVDVCRAKVDARERGPMWNPLWMAILPEVEKLSNEQLFLVSEFYYSWLGRLHRREIWSAVSVVVEGCSDDHFYEFCNGLITAGRVACEQILREPDSPETIFKSDSAYHGVGIIFVITDHFEDRTGFELPHDKIELRLEGEWVDEDSISERLPRCYKFKRDESTELGDG